MSVGNSGGFHLSGSHLARANLDAGIRSAQQRLDECVFASGHPHPEADSALPAGNIQPHPWLSAAQLSQTWPKQAMEGREEVFRHPVGCWCRDHQHLAVKPPHQASDADPSDRAR
jgi:hypothetical protein